MENIIAFITFIKTLSPFELFLLAGIILLAINQGWLTAKGFSFKKTPTQCLHGRSGTCQLLSKQMETAEVYIDKVATAALDHFLDMRAKRTGDDIILANDIESWCYDLTLFRISTKIKDDIRSFFQANHLAEMDENEFELYMKRRTDQIIVTMTALMDKLYFPGTDPSRRELYEYNQTTLMPIFHACMEATLRQGRQLAIQFAAGELDKHMEYTK